MAYGSETLAIKLEDIACGESPDEYRVMMRWMCGVTVKLEITEW